MLIETCPFDPTHRFKSTKKELHVQKCQLNHGDAGYVRCILDFNHIIRHDKKLEHLKECDAADESLCHLIFKISEAQKNYNLLYTKSKTSKDISFDVLTKHNNGAEPETVTKVKRWLDNNADLMLCSEVPIEQSNTPSASPIICNEDKSLPYGYEPLECEETEEYHRNLMKANSNLVNESKLKETEKTSTETRNGIETSRKYFSRSSLSNCPPPLRKASYFMKAKADAVNTSNSVNMVESDSDTSCDSSISDGSVYESSCSKKTSKPTLTELYARQKDDMAYTSISSNSNTKCENIADDDSVVSLPTTVSYNSSLYYPKRPSGTNGSRNRPSTLSTAYRCSKVPSVYPEDSISNVGVEICDDVLPLDIISDVSTRAVPVDIDSLVSSKGFSINNDFLVGSRVVPVDIESLVSSKVSIDRKSVVSRKALPLDIDSIVSNNAVPIDIESLVSNLTFLTANNEMNIKSKPSKSPFFPSSNNKPSMRSVSVQTEGLCKCHELFP